MARPGVSISVWDSRELQAAVYALKQANKTIRKEIFKRTREKVLPDWREAISTEIGRWDYDALGYRLLLKSTRVDVGTQQLSLRAATSTKAVTSGGLVPATQFYLYEFGATPHKMEINGRRGNTRYRYTRMVATGLPKRRNKGRAAYPAAAKMVTRAVALWVSSVIQVYQDAGRGKSI